MFRNRKSFQKPDDEFVNRFQRTFAEIVPRRNSDSRPNDIPKTDDPMMSARYANSDLLGAMSGAGTANEGFTPMANMKMEEHNLKLSDERTPYNLQDLSFTQSWLDSCPMTTLDGQHPSIYTPYLGRMENGAIFHNLAGDLHTPTLGQNKVTPLSLSNPMEDVQRNHQLGLGQFSQQNLVQHMTDMKLGQTSNAPSAFMHRDSGYDTMDESMDGSIRASSITASTVFATTGATSGMSYAEEENFRYNVTLRAPTAMVRHAREAPVSYLNKGQPYNLIVKDSNLPIVSSDPHKYRTYIRVSFENEEQRSKPDACWQLWKDGRGSNEAYQRGRKLLAVEYVDQFQDGGGNDKKCRVQIGQTSFDGFWVTWTANPSTDPLDCTIPVRFNFLSTDFTLSKGVKGIPVRLCAKTELLSPGEEVGAARVSEVCYCKVKVFRDHGAERKQSNDVAHVKKTIERLNQQIARAEIGGGVGKRKRGSNSAASIKRSDRSMNVSKHKRAWSIISHNQAPERISRDDLPAKLSTMQGMLSSTRTVSVLSLRGDMEDDPDLYPIRLPDDGESVKQEPLRRQNTGGSPSTEALIPSVSSSNISLDSRQVHPSQLVSLKNPTIAQKIMSHDTNISPRSIKAIDIDPEYRPPVERPPKPTACFYVRFWRNGERPPDYYHAIYLAERTVRNLVKKVSEKQNFDPARVTRIIHVNKDGTPITVDDDVVRDIPDGQDVVANIYEATSPDVCGDGGHAGASMEIKFKY